MFFSLGFLLTTIFFEVYLKTSEIKLPFKTLDESVGKTYQTNISIHENKEGMYVGESNAFGFIGKVLLKKKPRTYRIAFYGDSFTEAFQLSERYNFTKIIEQKLNSKLDINVEVLNFGMSNVTFTEMYIRKKTLADQFNIDLSVYMLDSYDFCIPSQSIVNSVKLTEKNGSLQIKKDTTLGYQYYKKLKPMIDNSSYLNLFMDSYFLFKRNQIKPVLLDKFYKEPKINQDYSYYDYYLQHLSSENELILSDIKNKPTVFVFRESIDPKLKKSLKKYNIPIIETKSVLDELRNKGINPYYWKLTQTEGHFNFEANYKIGTFLYEKLLPYIKN